MIEDLKVLIIMFGRCFEHAYLGGSLEVEG